MLRKYLITSREFYTDTPAVFRSILHEQLALHMPEYALYRDKANPSYALQAAHFVEVCSQFASVKSFIHRDIELAQQLQSRGVHLTSKQFDEIEKAKEAGLEVFISTHTHEEVLEAQRRGADGVTYSPIFTSPGKGEAKGIADLKELLQKVTIKVFALGGIVTQEQVQSIEGTSAYGFASIRYFYTN